MTVINSSDLGADRELVRALVEVLDDDEKTILVCLSNASEGFGVLAGGERLSKLGLLLEDGTVSKLGRAISEEVLRNDPDA